jgi:predicted O-methyltransferase YrrM
VLDDRVRVMLTRLEEEDAAERAAGVARELRSRQVTPATGRFLFTVVAPQAAVEILEIGGSRGYSAIWLASAARILGGTVVSLESDPAKCEAWRANIEEAGLAEWAELVDGDAFETLPAIEDVFDVVFLDAEKEDYEALFGLARRKLEPGALVIADNVLSHEELHPYSAARQADPSLVSVTVPLDRGLELSTVLSSV